jgi:hypothetical protein
MWVALGGEGWAGSWAKPEEHLVGHIRSSSFSRAAPCGRRFTVHIAPPPSSCSPRLAFIYTLTLLACPNTAHARSNSPGSKCGERNVGILEVSHTAPVTTIMR